MANFIQNLDLMRVLLLIGILCLSDFYVNGQMSFAYSYPLMPDKVYSSYRDNGLITNEINVVAKLSIISYTGVSGLSNQINTKKNNTISVLTKGTVVNLVYDLSCGMILYFAPTDYTHWMDGIKLDTYSSTFTRPPVWDKDPWYINYLGHPYQGAFYYNSVRQQGMSMGGSLAFSTFHSLVWEFLMEGSVEQPSINDLLVTPIVGSIVGEGVHRATKKMALNGFRFWEKVFVIVFNPNYVLRNGFAKRIGH